MFVNSYLANLENNNLRILKINSENFSGYLYYINMNTWRSFQICICVPPNNVPKAKIPFKKEKVDSVTIVLIIVFYLDCLKADQ